MPYRYRKEEKEGHQVMGSGAGCSATPHAGVAIIVEEGDKNESNYWVYEQYKS